MINLYLCWRQKRRGYKCIACTHMYGRATATGGIVQPPVTGTSTRILQDYQPFALAEHIAALIMCTLQSTEAYAIQLSIAHKSCSASVSQMLQVPSQGMQPNCPAPGTSVQTHHNDDHVCLAITHVTFRII